MKIWQNIIPYNSVWEDMSVNKDAGTKTSAQPPNYLVFMITGTES